MKTKQNQAKHSLSILFPKPRKSSKSPFPLTLQTGSWPLRALDGSGYSFLCRISSSALDSTAAPVQLYVTFVGWISEIFTAQSVFWIFVMHLWAPHPHPVHTPQPRPPWPHCPGVRPGRQSTPPPRAVAAGSSLAQWPDFVSRWSWNYPLGQFYCLGASSVSPLLWMHRTSPIQGVTWTVPSVLGHWEAVDAQGKAYRKHRGSWHVQTHLSPHLSLPTLLITKGYVA